MTVFSNHKFVPVTEKFVGNNRKEFQVIEEEMAKLVKKIKTEYGTLSDRISNGNIAVQLNSHDINNSPSNKKIEKMFKQIFGLKDFALSWMPSPESNAMTPPKSYQFLDPHYKTDSKGHRTNAHLFVGVIVFSGLVTYADLDEKELLGIILHEIGHNFYPSIFNVLCNISVTMPQLTQPALMGRIGTALVAMGVRDALSLNKLTYAIMSKVPDFISKEFPGMSKIYHTAEDIMYNASSLSIVKPKELLEILRGTRRFIAAPFSVLFLYNVEKHADSFANDYGYGEYAASGLAKLRYDKNSVRSQTVYSIPGLNWFFDFVDVQWEILSRPFIGYPSEQNRIRTHLDRLRRSAKDPNLDPRVRKELEKQIKSFEDYYYNDYLSISNDENKKRIFTWMYLNVVEKVFRGKADLREIIHAIDPHKYK